MWLLLIPPAVLLLPVLFWLFLPAFLADPMLELQRQTPARIFYDAAGQECYCEPTYDWQWRFAVPLEEISPAVIQVILATEDSDFYSHRGVDYAAVLRAAWQWLGHGRIISGASTISMQLARMAHYTPRRSLWRKIRQAGQGRKLEQLYDKGVILREYLNRLPFGGKIYGIEAAARYYFGKTAMQLSLAEASYLCGLPQRPNAYRPDRYPGRAKERQRVVLKLLVRQGMLTAGQAREILLQEKLPLRDFARPADFLHPEVQPEDRHFLVLAGQESGGADRVRTSWQPQLQRSIRGILQRQGERLPGVADAAAVLLDNQQWEVLALVGTLNFSSLQGGEVNAALAERCAGSVLKPFLYAEAIEGGLLVMDSRLDDSPIRYANYRPGNYDGGQSGMVRAGAALSRSLNIPAVRIMAELGVPRVVELLQQLQLCPPGAPVGLQNGLAIALGSAGHSLLALTRAYQVFPNGGRWRPASFLRGRPAEADARLFQPGSMVMLSAMLQERMLPGTTLEVCWKTGTSSGNHDAWCFAYTREYTLGVWFGNKDGSGAAALVGSSAAAPCAGEIMQLLYRDRQPGAWPHEDELLEKAALCRRSGLLRSSSCQEESAGLVVKGIPLRTCRLCRQGADAVQPPAIISPGPSQYVADSPEGVLLPVQASVEAVFWFDNSRSLGRLLPGAKVRFGVGRHILTAVPDDPQRPAAVLEFTVLASPAP
ncbi:MAG: hypothetical protein GX564_02865 [Oligosphaeraceae bacterium]|nr:hypothetical protein [Oligosphaeraceae bacterium]